MSSQKKSFPRLPSTSKIRDGLRSLRNHLPSLGSPSRAPSPPTSRPSSRKGHNTHIQSANPNVSAAQVGSSYGGMWSSMKSLHQLVNWLILVAKDYAKITLNGTYELLKIVKESSGMLAPLSSAIGSVIACVDLYKVSSVTSMSSILPYSMRRQHPATIKRWNGSPKALISWHRYLRIS